MAADNQKLYQNIIAALQADIAAGRFREGDRLPPERVLVERFQVSRLTIREAMIGMEILGLVAAVDEFKGAPDSRHGSATPGEAHLVS